MNTWDYMLMWLIVITLAGVGDHVWTRSIRPRLVKAHGWPEMEPDEIIPGWAWVGALVVTVLLFVVVPFVGYAAGF